MKEIEAIAPKKVDVGGMKKFRDYIGKKVISKSGGTVGRVFDIAFREKSVEGIIVMKRISKLFIAREYVASMTSDAIMLSIDPSTMLVGRQVFDADGKKLGKVAKVLRKGMTNEIDAVIVRKNLYSKPLKISKQDIEACKKNILLKKMY